jgi:hypothetical protein
MKEEKQIQAIASFEYTADEARFLRLVALHGGYFLRRRFLYSAQCDFGRRVRDFIDKAHRSQIRAANSIAKTAVLRAHYKAIYAAVGKGDSRNRREHQPSTISLGLMGLILSYSIPNIDSSQLFRRAPLLFEERKTDGDLLPSRAFCIKGTLPHPFVDGFPSFLDAGEARTPSVCYIDDGQSTSAALRSYLWQYHRWH